MTRELALPDARIAPGRRATWNGRPGEVVRLFDRRPDGRTPVLLRWVDDGREAMPFLDELAPYVPPASPGSILAPGIPGVSPTCCPGANLEAIDEAGVRCCECHRVWRARPGFRVWDLVTGPYVRRSSLS